MNTTIGRIVHYYEGDFEPSTGSATASGTNGTRWHPAIITRVWTDDCVNLIIFFDATSPQVRTSMNRLPDEVFADGMHCTNSGWRWPPKV